MSENFDILVVGGGVNGLLLSHALSKAGNSVALIDSIKIKDRINRRIDGRGIAISKNSEDFFRSLEIWEDIYKSCGEIKKIHISDYNGKSELNFDSREINESRLGVIVEMDHIQDVIYHKIHSLRSVKIFDNQKISDVSEDDTGVTVKSEKDVFKSKLLIACDGKNSHIRNYLKIRNFCHSYEQVAAVFNISHELDHNNTACEFFYPNGPLAFLPRKNSHESSVVWVEKKMDGGKGEYFNNKLFLEELGKRLYPTHGSVKLISQINHYPLYLQFSKKYFSNKTIFIGDSLHHIHPVAGQGFNLSVKDIICLVNLIDDYKSYGFLINDRKLFEEFFKKRVISNANMIGITHGLNLVFSNNNFVLKKFRNFGVGLINKSGYLKNILMNYAMGRK